MTAVVCPLCRHRMSALRSPCPSCQGDLSALTGLVRAADHRFNQGLELASHKDYLHAAEEFAAALALNPEDEEARRLLEEMRDGARKSAKRPKTAKRSRRPK